MPPNQWVKGQSGNPKGRTKGKTVAELQRKLGYELISDNQGNIRATVEKLFEHSMKGAPWAIKTALEYFMGKPRPYDMPESSEYTEMSYSVSNMPPETRRELEARLKETRDWIEDNVNNRNKIIDVEDMH